MGQAMSVVRNMFCIRKKPTPETPKEGKNIEIFVKDEKGEVRGVSSEFWQKLQETTEKFPEAANKSFGTVTHDILDASAEFWEAIEDVIPEEVPEGVTEAAKSFLNGEAFRAFLQFGKMVPWIEKLVEIGSIVYLGAQEVLQNKENCENLGKYYKKVIQIVLQAPEEKLTKFKQARKDTGLSRDFVRYLHESVLLINRFNHRSHIMAFLMRTKDAEDFKKVKMGLQDTITLLVLKMNLMGEEATEERKQQIKQQLSQENIEFHEENTTIKREVEEMLGELGGDGNVARGLLIMADKNADKNTKVLKMEAKIREKLSQLDVEVDFSESAVSSLRKSKDVLPDKLSVQLKMFWVDNYGPVSQVDWNKFVEDVERLYKSFLESDEVDVKCEKKLSQQKSYVGGKKLTRYLLRGWLDPIETGSVNAIRLNEVYLWSIEQWEKEGVQQRSYPPRTLGDILATFVRHIDEASDYVMEYQTMDYDSQDKTFKTIVGVFQENQGKLGVIRELNLSRNPFGDTGLRKVCEQILQYMPNIEVVRMESCSIGLGHSTKGSLDGLQNLIQMKTLRVLQLSKNDIGDHLLENYIVKGLLQSPVDLDELDLSDNLIMDAGAQKLKEALEQEDCNIREINLYGNKITTLAIQQFTQLKGITIILGGQNP
eukprot:TRINITY_DN7379_c0_g1_i12.p1 TRINITY_DN7379_c0_g1~~TRINITY_DN7379_c0_g1_i12.p1  ORF type:complete len:666 (-),score=99.04 TRINITY_DN7379_c0_g1_i12:1346-3307(-)